MCKPLRAPHSRNTTSRWDVYKNRKLSSVVSHDTTSVYTCPCLTQQKSVAIPVMPPSHLPRVEELEFWSTGEKTRVKHSSAKELQDTVTISTELYERLLHATKHAAPDASGAGSKRANAGPFGLFGYELVANVELMDRLFITTMAFSCISLNMGGSTTLNALTYLFIL
jgi:hypothetical protein